MTLDKIKKEFEEKFVSFSLTDKADKQVDLWYEDVDALWRFIKHAYTLGKKEGYQDAIIEGKDIRKLNAKKIYEEGRKEGEKEIIEEAIKIIKPYSYERLYLNIPTNAKMPFTEYIMDRVEKLANLLTHKK